MRSCDEVTIYDELDFLSEAPSWEVKKVAKRKKAKRARDDEKPFVAQKQKKVSKRVRENVEEEFLDFKQLNPTPKIKKPIVLIKNIKTLI